MSPLGATRDNVAETSYDASHRVQITRQADGSYVFSQASFPMWIYSGVLRSTPPPVTTISSTVTIDGNPLIIHTGTKANQNLHLYFNDMHSKAMGIDQASVTTRGKATSALSMIDNAIQYTLNEATTVGAYSSRLDTEHANITTAEENTQSSESAIRDADMAKEMTEYTKNNVLLQASQSMLAQANQSSSSVLSLLQ